MKDTGLRRSTGQTAASFSEQQVNPSYCLWPTPQWLWDNDKGQGKGSGTWKTLTVRGWMDKLDIKRHYVMFHGLQQID